MGYGYRYRYRYLDTGTKIGIANTKYTIRQANLQSNVPVVSTQPHSGTQKDSIDGHTSVTKVQASSQLLQSLPLCQAAQIIFAPGQIGPGLPVNTK